MSITMGDNNETVILGLRVEMTEFVGGMTKAEGMTDRLVGKYDGLANSLNAVGVRAAAAGAAILGLAGVAVKQAVDLERELANVSTLVDTSVVSMDEIKKGLMGMDSHLGDVTENTKAMYQALSSGIKPAESLMFVAAAAKAAKAGLTDTFTAVDSGTTVLNAFGLQAKDAGQVFDVMFKTVEIGKLTFEQLSASMGQVVPIAAQAGMKFDEVGAALATLTQGGLSADEAATQLKAILAGLISPSDEAAASFAQLGIDISSARIEQEGLLPIMEEIRQKTGGNIEAMGRLFPNIRALGGAATLAGGQFDSFVKALDATRNSVGATDAAFEKQMKALGAALDALVVDLKKLAVEAGNDLVPVIRLAAKAMEGFLDVLRAMPDWMRKVVVIGGTGAGAAAGLAGTMMLIAGQGIEAYNSIAKLGTALGITGTQAAVAAGKFGLVAAALAAGIALGVGAEKGMESLSESAEKGSESAKVLYNALTVLGGPIGLLIRGFDELERAQRKAMSEMEAEWDKSADSQAKLLKLNEKHGTAFTKLSEAMSYNTQKIKENAAAQEAAARAQFQAGTLQDPAQKAKFQIEAIQQVIKAELGLVEARRQGIEDIRKFEELEEAARLQRVRGYRIMTGQQLEQVEFDSAVRTLQIKEKASRDAIAVLEEELRTRTDMLRAAGENADAFFGEDAEKRTEALEALKEQILEIEQQLSEERDALAQAGLQKMEVVNTRLLELANLRKQAEQDAASEIVKAQNAIVAQLDALMGKLKSLTEKDKTDTAQENQVLNSIWGTEQQRQNLFDQLAQLTDRTEKAADIADPTERLAKMNALWEEGQKILEQAREEGELGEDNLNHQLALHAALKNLAEFRQEARAQEIAGVKDEMQQQQAALEAVTLKRIEFEDKIKSSLEDRLNLEKDIARRSKEQWDLYLAGLVGSFDKATLDIQAFYNRLSGMPGVTLVPTGGAPATGPAASESAPATTSSAGGSAPSSGKGGSTVTIEKIEQQILGGGDMVGAVINRLIPAMVTAAEITGKMTSSTRRGPRPD